MSNFQGYQAMIEQMLIDNNIVYRMAKESNDPENIENAQTIEDLNVVLRNNIKAYYEVRR